MPDLTRSAAKIRLSLQLGEATLDDILPHGFVERSDLFRRGLAHRERCLVSRDRVTDHRRAAGTVDAQHAVAEELHALDDAGCVMVALLMVQFYM